MIQFKHLIREIMANGHRKGDRTGTGTLSIFAYQLRFNLQLGFPILTGKKTPFKTMAKELLWFLSGSDNVKPLQEQGVRIWDEWADPNTGNLGPIYGYQWRKWPRLVSVPFGDPCEEDLIDQIAQVINTLKTNPDDRRMIVSAWNVSDIEQMALPPCHVIFQFYTHELELIDRINLAMQRELLDAASAPHVMEKHEFFDELGLPRRALSCRMWQRSCDVFLGVPFNIASYALLMHMVAQVVGMFPYELILDLGDAHLYSNHMDQAREYLMREMYNLPQLRLSPDIDDIDKFRIDHMWLDGYVCGDHIKAPIAV